MTKRKYGLIALAIGCFATISFVNHQNVQAAETVIKNKARIDTEYPLGGASNFMMVAGNQFIQMESAFSGRVMANSVIFTRGDNSEISPPGFNGSAWQDTDGNLDNYFKGLQNPAVIINDFTKANNDVLKKVGVKEKPDYSNGGDGSKILYTRKQMNMKNIMFNLGGMWKNSGITIGDNAISNNTQFATDTSLSEVEDNAEYKGLTEQLAGYSDKNVASFADIWGKSMLGTGSTLSRIPQYVDNGINQYETAETPTDEKYSLQENIQDISQDLASLTPSDGVNDLDPASNFWTSSRNIINDQQSATDSGVKSNPIYVKDEKWPIVTDVVVNITAAADNPNASKASRAKARAKAAETDKKDVVAFSIDRDKLIKANPEAKRINIVFNFSKSFYVGEDKTNPFDTSKMPYIILNYRGFGDKRFDFSQGDGFYIGDLNNCYLPGDYSLLGKPNYARSIATEVGASNPDEWQNDSVLNFGSHLLNNFTDAYDSDNYPESFNQEVQDKAGLTGETAAVSFTNKSPGTMLFGTMLVPHGSYYANSSTHSLYIGGIVAANNITLNNAVISPKHDKAIFGRDDDFPGIEPSTPSVTIDSIDLAAPTKATQNVVNDGTAKFSYVDDSLAPAPSLGITGELKLSNVPDSYGLYYRYNRNGNNDKGDWQRYSAGAQTGTSVTLKESLLADLNNQTKATAGTMKTEAQKISYPLTKTSGIEFATTADAKAATIAADKIETTATFKFTLQIDASLEVTVPAKISFGTDILGNSSGEATRTVAINEIQLTQKTVADTGTPEEPKVVVYNPLLSGFNLKLAYLDANATSPNPFYITGNFKYYINPDKSGSLASDETNGEWIDGILKRDTTPQSLETKTENNGLKSNSLQLHLPYRNDYKVSSNAYTAPMGWQLTL
ncbi:hypothetical protein [Latilactobacillus sakei]|uniref:hypothetical protein n=1 Tax=Latilactobacillus sakei TaxID=1599 RepID=UPI003F53C4E6